MAVWFDRYHLYFSGDAYWFIKQNNFRYATISATPNYGMIRIRFYRERVPNSYVIREGKYDFRISCTFLTRKLLDLGAEVADYEILEDQDAILITTNLEEQEVELLPFRRRREIARKELIKILPPPFKVAKTRDELKGVYFVGSIAKWIRDNNFRCVEVYVDDIVQPTYMEFRFYRKAECEPDMQRLVYSGYGGMQPMISSTVLARLIEENKLVPKDYEIVGNVLRVWLTIL